MKKLTLAKKKKSFEKDGKVINYLQLYLVVHTDDGLSTYVPIQAKGEKNYLAMFAEEIQ